MEINLVGHIIKHETLKTAVVQDCILNIDFMMSNKFDLIIINNYMLPYEKKIVSNCCRVSFFANTIANPNSEIAVKANLFDHVEKDN